MIEYFFKLIYLHNNFFNLKLYNRRLFKIKNKKGFLELGTVTNSYCPSYIQGVTTCNYDRYCLYREHILR